MVSGVRREHLLDVLEQRYAKLTDEDLRRGLYMHALRSMTLKQLRMLKEQNLASCPESSLLAWGEHLLQEAVDIPLGGIIP